MRDACCERRRAHRRMERVCVINFNGRETPSERQILRRIALRHEIGTGRWIKRIINSLVALSRAREREREREIPPICSPLSLKFSSVPTFTDSRYLARRPCRVARNCTLFRPSVESTFPRLSFGHSREQAEERISLSLARETESTGKQRGDVIDDIRIGISQEAQTVAEFLASHSRKRARQRRRFDDLASERASDSLCLS
jgi:hypothetical protein